MGIFECRVVPEEENKEVKGLAAAAAVAVTELEEGKNGLEGLATAAEVPEAAVEKGHPKPLAALAGAAAKIDRCKGFCVKPGTATTAPRAVRFVGNLANALDAALPIAAPRLLGFAMISPMVLGLSFAVLMVKPLYLKI
jgi:acetylornithine deacetylase/succinyl-diaminopimelate desuccinylase-like protein